MVSHLSSFRKSREYVEDPVARMGEIWAKLYYHLAREFVALGPKGEEALRRGIRNFARDRGEAMRRVAEERGLPLTLDTLMREPPEGVHDMPFRRICEEALKNFPDVKIDRSKPIQSYSEAGFCAYAAWWAQYPDGLKLGKIYCDEFHHVRNEAFNPKLRIDMLQYITRGDQRCVLRSYFEGDDYDKKRQAVIREICSKARSYGFIIDSSEYGNIQKACEEILTGKKNE